MNLLYFYINFGVLLVPFLFSFHPKIQFYKQWKYFFPTVIIVSMIFIIWDIRFTQLLVWGFNPIYIVGKYFYGLPIEEVLFFYAIPYSCLFTYYCFSLFVKKDILKTYEYIITLLLIFLMSVLAILNYQKLYTVYTFSSLSVLLIYLRFFAKIEWLNRFYFTYLIILIPFVIVNGVLTGTGIDHPIVWYDNGENLGIRILTIPVEDIFYGMLLLLLNTTLYEFFTRKLNG